MTLISDLPLGVLELILGHAVDKQALNAWTWHSQLPLLAVCRQWRRIAAPLVYSLCFIKLREDFGYHSSSDNSDSDSDFESASDDSCVLLESNVETIVLNDTCHMVKHMHLTLLWPSNPMVYIDEVLLKLDFGGNSWSNVETLTIAFTSASSDHGLESDIEIIQIEEDVTRSAKAFSQLMPNIASFNIHAYTSNALAEVLAGELADIYAPQLQSLKCNIPLNLTVLNFTDSLTHLDLQLNPASSWLTSQINARSLESLVLSNVPLDFSWRYFIGDSKYNSDNITFARLHTLSLAYAAQPNKYKDGNDDTCKLFFPRLRSLSIQSCPTNCAVLRASEYPLALDKVYILGPFAAARALSLMDLSSINVLSISVTAISQDDIADFYEVTNRIYKNISIARSSKLILPRIGFSLDPSNIEWPNITELVCKDPIEFSALVKLLPRLSNVRNPEFISVTLDSPPPFLSLKQDMEDPAEPASFNTKIERLRLFINANVYPVALAASAVQYLMLRLPSLRCVYLAESVHTDTRYFIEQFSPQYPHLKNILVEYAF